MKLANQLMRYSNTGMVKTLEFAGFFVERRTFQVLI
jgi:hypothetical protein